MPQPPPPLAVALAVLAVGAVSLAAGCSDDGTQRWTARLTPVNDSGVQGRGELLIDDDQLTVHLDARGLTPNLVHGQAFVASRRTAGAPSAPTRMMST